MGMHFASALDFSAGMKWFCGFETTVNQDIITCHYKTCDKYDFEFRD